jgi:hypothetical protein
MGVAAKQGGLHNRGRQGVLVVLLKETNEAGEFTLSPLR